MNYTKYTNNTKYSLSIPTAQQGLTVPYPNTVIHARKYKED